MIFNRMKFYIYMYIYIYVTEQDIRWQIKFLGLFMSLLSTLRYTSGITF